MKNNAHNEKFPGFPKEPFTNYWPYPRALNGWWHALSGSEQKMLDYILRHTWGYNKTADFISYSQLSCGIKTRAGKQIDCGCGIKHRKTLKIAIDGLVSKGFVEITQRSGRTTHFRLKLSDSEERVQSVNWCGSQTEQVGCSRNEQTIKDITRKDIQYSNASVATVSTNPLIELFKPINPSYRQLFKNKTQRAALERLVLEHGSEKIRDVLEKLPTIITRRFAPNITTPLQLEMKLGALLVYMQQERSKLPTVAKIR